MDFAVQLFGMKPLLITSCSNRKRSRREPVRLVRDFDSMSLSAAAKSWKAVLESAADFELVSALYGGRAFSEMRSVCTSLSTDLYIVSAGLGLVHESDRAPNYDLTIADDSSLLAATLRAAKARPVDWWRELREVGIGRGSLAALIRGSGPRLTLLAMPAGYLEMVAPELQSMPDLERAGLRIFTSPAGLASLPAGFKRVALPYDERLESVRGFAGTRSDFPQRALRHFVEFLGGHRLTLDDARAAVATALNGLDYRRIPSRTRLADRDIENLLRQNWVAHQGSSTRLLAFLRHEAKVACEQSRFRNIWRGLKEERAAERAST
jgi:hypothetical protein